MIPEWIKIEDLKGGYLYKIGARNADYGIWIPERKGFAISRVKFGSNYIFEEYHWDCPAFATAKPIEEIEKSPFEADVIEILHTESEDGKTKYFGYRDEDKLLKYLNKFEAREQ